MSPDLAATKELEDACSGIHILLLDIKLELSYIQRQTQELLRPVFEVKLRRYDVTVKLDSTRIATDS